MFIGALRSGAILGGFRRLRTAFSVLLSRNKSTKNSPLKRRDGSVEVTLTSNLLALNTNGFKAQSLPNLFSQSQPCADSPSCRGRLLPPINRCVPLFSTHKCYYATLLRSLNTNHGRRKATLLPVIAEGDKQASAAFGARRVKKICRVGHIFSQSGEQTCFVSRQTEVAG